MVWVRWAIFLKSGLESKSGCWEFSLLFSCFCFCLLTNFAISDSITFVLFSYIVLIFPFLLSQNGRFWTCSWFLRKYCFESSSLERASVSAVSHSAPSFLHSVSHYLLNFMQLIQVPFSFCSAPTVPWRLHDSRYFEITFNAASVIASHL